MRRLSLLLPLLMPLPAEANEAFCPALKRLTAAAQWGFNDIARTPHLIPGSIAEHRGEVRRLDGPVRGAIFATMYRAQGREHQPQVARSFEQWQAEIGRCLTDAQATPPARAATEVKSSWATPYAVVELRADLGDGFASTMEVEIVVSSRW